MNTFLNTVVNHTTSSHIDLQGMPTLLSQLFSLFGGTLISVLQGGIRPARGRIPNMLRIELIHII